MGMFPAALGGAPVVPQVEYPASGSSSESRKDLNKRLKTQDKTFADVSMASGGPIAALRIAGADAAPFIKDLILTMGLGGAYTIEPEDVPNGTIGVVRGPNDYVFYVYPKDDVFWGVVAEEPLVTETFASLPGAPVPPVLPEPTPAPTPDISTPEGYLASLLPATVGGEALTVQVYPADGRDAVRRPEAVQGGAQGPGQDDRRPVARRRHGTASGTGPSWAFRIVGGDAAPLEDVVLKFLKDAGQVDKKAKPEPAEVAGKSARRHQDQLRRCVPVSTGRGHVARHEP